MRKAAGEWSDARLDAFAAALETVPGQIAVLDATVRHVEHVAAALEPVPARVAVLSAAVERLAEENRVLRGELAAMQRQLSQIGWGLVAALVGATAAVIAALL